jgi:hypothetical protein
MKHQLLIACVLCLCLSSIAQADYVLNLLSGGSSSATVNWGDSLTLDAVLTSDAADVHDSAIFRMIFTMPGLTYPSYSWASPYTNGPPYDDSTPILGDLPVTLDEDTLSGTGYPSGVVDIEMSNVLIGSTFGEGTLVSLDLTVPAGFGYQGSLYIAASPDTFADGYTEISTTAGQVFELIVVPEPSTCAALLAVTLGFALRSRRRA